MKQAALIGVLGSLLTVQVAAVPQPKNVRDLTLHGFLRGEELTNNYEMIKQLVDRIDDVAERRHDHHHYQPLGRGPDDAGRPANLNFNVLAVGDDEDLDVEAAELASTMSSATLGTLVTSAATLPTAGATTTGSLAPEETSDPSNPDDLTVTVTEQITVSNRLRQPISRLE